MRIALRKNHRITSNEVHRWLPSHLYIAFSFGNHVENYHSLGTRL